MPKTYSIPPAKIAPITLAAFAICLGIVFTPWMFAALPFIYLGSICASPNFNLADGFLVLISIIFGVGVLLLKKDIGLIIIISVSSSWILSAIEKAITAKPQKEDE